MSELAVCRLCVNDCTDYKSLYSGYGRGNELHRLTVKYFHPEPVNMDESTHLTVICTQCLRCIYDFHSFQTSVSVAQLKLLDDHYVECIKIDPEEILMERNNPHVPSCSMVLEQDSTPETQAMIGQQETPPESQAMSVQQGTPESQSVEEGRLSTTEAETASTTSIREEQLGGALGLNVIKIESFCSLVPQWSNRPLSDATDTICTMVHVSADIKRETTIDSFAVDDNDESARTEDRPKESAAIENFPHHQTNEAEINEIETETSLTASPSAEIPQKNIRTSPRRSRKHYKVPSETPQAVARSPFKCNQCPCSYTTTTSLRRHQRKHHPEVNTPTRELRKNPKPEQEFEYDNSKGKFKCNLCDCLYFVNRNFVKHMNRVHGKVIAAPDTKSSECLQCGKVFCSNKDMKSHLVRVHEPSGSYSCQECGKAFTKYSYYTYHVRHKHNGPRYYTCSTCGKTFNRPSKLQMHRISHTNEAPPIYLCPFCPKSFKYSHTLKHHQNVAHPPGN